MSDGAVWQYQYDEVGNRVERIDPLGARTQWVYNASNQVIETIFPDLVSESPDTKRQEVPILDSMGNDTGETEEKDVDLGTTTKAVKYSILSCNS